MVQNMLSAFNISIDNCSLNVLTYVSVFCDQSLCPFPAAELQAELKKFPKARGFTLLMIYALF